MRLNVITDKEVLNFLTMLAQGKQPGPVLKRREDRIRQHCRRRGWTEFVPHTPVWSSHPGPKKWRITDLGRQALESHRQYLNNQADLNEALDDGQR